MGSNQQSLDHLSNALATEPGLIQLVGCQSLSHLIDAHLINPGSFEGRILSKLNSHFLGHVALLLLGGKSPFDLIECKCSHCAQ